MLWLILSVEALIAVVIVVQMIRKRSALREDGDLTGSPGDVPAADFSLPEEEKWE